MEPGAVCDAVPEFHQDKSLVWIEYPAVIKNVDKMIKTLGGPKNISGTYREDNKRLDLRFRPDDPCCHPVCGDRAEVTALMLKVKKYRRKKNPGEISKPDEFRYRPEIIGVVETGYKFNALCDFQYLPLHNDLKNDKLVNMVPHLKVQNLAESTYTKDVPLFLPPATFSRFDQQQDVLFRSAPKYRRQTVHPDKISVTRPRRTHFAQYLKFEENWTPKEPLPAARILLDRITKAEDALVAGVKKLFEQRPIWSKNAITCQLECPHERLKNVLPAVAYYFITGPWRSLWVKLGYDPRIEPEAAKFQLLDFRVRQGLNTPHIPIKAKRSALSYRLPNLTPRSKLSSSNMVNSLDEQNSSSASSARTNHSEAVYIFKTGTLPAYRQTFYQICDIYHPAVIEIVSSHKDSHNSCNLKSGWFPEDMAAKVRDILSKDIQNTIATTEGMQPILNMERQTRKKWGVRLSKNSDFSSNTGTPEDVEGAMCQGIQLESSSEEEKRIFNDAAEASSNEPEYLLPEDQDLENVNMNEEEESNFEGDDDADSVEELDMNEPYFDENVDDLTDFLEDIETYSPGDFDENAEED